MNIVIWIIIIFIAVLLIWLLKKWIRRLIFIAILLIIAFFIYGLFSPSGASKLRYNVRTFPDRIVSWFSNKSFIDYDTYKLDFSSIGSKDKSDLLNEDIDLDISNTDIDLNVDSERNDEGYSTSKQNNTDIEIMENNSNIEVNKDNTTKKNTIKSFGSISPLKFVNMKEKWEDENELDQNVSGYSKSDLLGIISTYIENNLNDDTEILVTIEYSEEGEADKIILKTQPKSKSSNGVLSIPRLSLEKMIDGIYKSKYETVVIDDDTSVFSVSDDDSLDNNTDNQGNDKSDSDLDNNLIVEVEGKKDEERENTTSTVTQTVTQKTTQTQTRRKTSNGLSQKDIREAEELFGALF